MRCESRKRSVSFRGIRQPLTSSKTGSLLLHRAETERSYAGREAKRP